MHWEQQAHGQKALISARSEVMSMWDVPVCVMGPSPVYYTERPSRRLVTPDGGLEAEEEAGLEEGLGAGLDSLDPGLDGSAGKSSVNYAG